MLFLYYDLVVKARVCLWLNTCWRDLRGLKMISCLSLCDQRGEIAWQVKRTPAQRIENWQTQKLSIKNWERKKKGKNRLLDIISAIHMLSKLWSSRRLQLFITNSHFVNKIDARHKTFYYDDVFVCNGRPSQATIVVLSILIVVDPRISWKCQNRTSSCQLNEILYRYFIIIYVYSGTYSDLHLYVDMHAWTHVPCRVACCANCFRVKLFIYPFQFNISLASKTAVSCRVCRCVFPWRIYQWLDA